MYTYTHIGTGKWIIKAHLDCMNKNEPYYLKPEDQKPINEKLATICVPHDMNWKPRSLNDISQWKGLHVCMNFSLVVFRNSRVIIICNSEYVVTYFSGSCFQLAKFNISYCILVFHFLNHSCIMNTSITSLSFLPLCGYCWRERLPWKILS